MPDRCHGSGARVCGRLERSSRSRLPSSGACHSTFHGPSCPASPPLRARPPRAPPEAVLAPADTAGNLGWSWHPPTQDVFAEVDAETWEAVKHDPVRLLGAVSPDHLEDLAADQGFLDRLGAAKADLDAYLGGERWYTRKAPADAPTRIAYFSPEFGITGVLPQYAGGLGILAGDHLKAASDLGVPLVGVGLLYHAGYFKQSLSREGWQLEQYPVLDPAELPISLLREENGARATISI